MCPQRRQPILVPLPDDSQRILLLDLGHLVPVCNAAERSVLVDDQRAHCIELDAIALAHVQLYRLSVPGRGQG